MKRLNREPGHHNRLGKTVLVAGVAVSALTACGLEGAPREPVAHLTPEQQNNLKMGALGTVDKLLTSGEVLTSDGRLDIRISDQIPGQIGEKTKHEMVFNDSTDIAAVATLSADGAQIEATRIHVSYCSDNVTNDIAEDGDCALDSGYIDRGYRAVFTNPDIKSIDPNTPLTVETVRSFVEQKGTYLSSIGDAYELTTYNIDKEGSVSDGDSFDLPKQGGVVNELSDLVNAG